MKRYYKIIDGQKVFAENNIIIGDMRVFNPTEEQLLSEGWQEYIPPEVIPYSPSLDELIMNKINEIENYDTSEEVNSFTINGQTGWIDRNTRVALLRAIEVTEENGSQEYTVWFSGQPMTLPTTVIKQFLKSLELYAIQALNVTNQHILEVSQLKNSYDLENYDITQGYPEKINLEI